MTDGKVDDSTTDMKERLDALESAFNDEIANLLAKNAELEAQNLKADERISELESLMAHQKGNDLVGDTNDDDDGLISMNFNTYTFLYTTPTWSAPFITGVATCVIQYAVFSLFLLDLLKTSGIPPGVAAIVRACQVIAIVIAFLVETDMLRALRALIFREGFVEMEATFDGFSPCKFYSANALMGLQEGSLMYLHIFLYGLTMVAVFIAFGSIAGLQDSQSTLAEFVKVQFGDEADPTLGLFSGCYKKQLSDGWDARVRYVHTQTNRGPGDFEYCLDDGLQTWVFATSQSSASTNNCYESGFALRSAEQRSTSFDLLDAKGDQWLLGTGNPISEFRLGEIDPSRFEIECGNIPLQGGALTDELCPVLTIDADDNGFSGSHDWSRTFVFLKDSKNETVQFYQRPVFIGESSTEGYEILFFAGRRWVLARATELLVTGDEDEPSMEEVISLFESSDFWLLELPADKLAYLSEAVSQVNDRGTPLGLQWYNARYGDGVAFPFADISRHVDASFRCGKCNNRTNPCLHEGICKDDGTCFCSHGASGKLCEIKPLGDGVCNPYFNTDPDGYDGGDCCVATCSKTKCGVNGTTFAFGQELRRRGIGFPHCRDPLMVPYTIILESDLWWDQTGANFESFTVEVVCEEEEKEEKSPLRVALDPRIVGSLNETLYLEDKAGSCLLSFIGIQSWSGLNISYQIFDGADSTADSMMLMGGETNIEADGVHSLPVLYSRCLKETLAGVIEKKHLYTGSYQDKAFAWLNNETSINDDCSSNVGSLTERYALLALSAAEEAPEGAESWISSIDHCRWPRVTCDGSGVVELTYDGKTNGVLKGSWASEFTLLRNLERLDVFSNRFSEGTIPNSISELTALTFLALSGNFLSGSLPTELGGMMKLSILSLYENALTGTLPTELGDLGSLIELKLDINSFSGSLPTDFGKMSALTTLSLSRNSLSGSLPSEIGKLSALEKLLLSGNALSGSIPKEIWSLSSLVELELVRNVFSGDIPKEIGTLSNLTLLGLSGSGLTGRIPSEVGYLSALNYLFMEDSAFSGSIPSEVGGMGALSRAYLTNNVLSGSIPSEVANMSSLRVLHVFNNTLSGNIPSEVGNMRRLTKLDLHNNALSGSLPTEIGSTPLREFFLYSNNLSGSIPSEIGMMRFLWDLYLFNNALSGSLPTQVGNMGRLKELYLHNNALSGMIPTEIGNLNSLSLLRLHNNNFSGSIPSEIGNLGSLRTLYLRNNTLSGSIPTEIGSLQGLAYLDVGDNLLSERLPSEIGQMTNLEYLILSDNKLSGPLPTEILQLTNLRLLELSGNRFSEEEVESVMAALGLAFSCNETTLEMKLNTDSWSTETKWEISDYNGTIAALGDGYRITSFAYKEEICVPSDACSFTLVRGVTWNQATAEITRLGKVYQVDGNMKEKIVVDICI